MRSRNRWLTLFAVTRSVATVVGVGLVVVHTVTDYDLTLAIVAGAYGAGSVIAALRLERLHRSVGAWIVDIAAVLGLVLAAQSWRSPFYVLALTALIFPATALPFRRAIACGLLFTASYFGIAVATGIDWRTLDRTSRLESLSTHVMVPLLVVLALAYAARLLRRLEREQERSAELAIDAERRRIAWDLHDSAKQRVHAAHLLLSSALRRDRDEKTTPMIEQALTELEAAATDIDTNLGELRTPLQEHGLTEALSARAAELGAAGGARIEVTGDPLRLPTFVAAHAFRVASEAMTNAVRHADASRIDVRLARRDGRLELEVEDDGRGIDDGFRPGSTGLRSMHARARMLEGELTIAPAAETAGTTVRLNVPLDEPAAAG